MDLIKENGNTISDMEHIGRSYRLLRKQYGNGDLIEYIYDHGRRLTTKESKNLNTNSLINKYEYGYNKVHMKTFEQRMHDNSKGDVFDYDELYRLTNVKFNVPDPTVENPTEFEKEKTFNFDKLDNILSIVENFNGQTKTITTEIPENSNYSKLNQYASFDQWGLSYDLNGNTTQKGTQHFVYDYRNQLVRVTDGSTITENKYDALGRRLQKVVTSGSQSKTENFYYSGQQVVEVRDGNDQVKRQFIYGNGIDEVIRMDTYSGSTITQYYFHSNAIGSTTAVTDANGNVVERYKYSLFGMPTFLDAAGNVIPNSTLGNNILFQGREYEPETNFYYFRARHLDPIMGRFLQTDPMGYKDSLNLYQAFNMNPVNFVDPYGEAIIILDPGHGDKLEGKAWPDKGAPGIGGKPPHEADYTYPLTKKIGNELVKLGHTVFYTRQVIGQAAYLTRKASLKQRSKFSDSKNADFYISIHLNSFSKNKNYFMVAFYQKKKKGKIISESKEGKKLAESIAKNVYSPKEWVQILNFQIPISKEALGKGFSNVKTEGHNYVVLRSTKAPAILIEAGNIKYPLNKMNLNRNDFVDGIVNGIDVIAREKDKKKLKQLISIIKGVIVGIIGNK